MLDIPSCPGPPFNHPYNTLHNSFAEGWERTHPSALRCLGAKMRSANVIDRAVTTVIDFMANNEPFRKV